MQRQYLHVAVIFPPTLAGKDNQRKHRQKWCWNVFFYLSPSKDGTDVLMARAWLCSCSEEKIGVGGATLKKEVRSGKNATWPHTPSIKLWKERKKEKACLDGMTWLAHMPFSHGEGALLCGSCF